MLNLINLFHFAYIFNTNFVFSIQTSLYKHQAHKFCVLNIDPKKAPAKSNQISSVNSVYPLERMYCLLYFLFLKLS